ncbi:hypothetical protein NDU88_004769, partial [Pleurodeles waltl]
GAWPSSRRWRTPNPSAPEGPELRLLSCAAPRGKLKKKRSGDLRGGAGCRRSPERTLPSASVACGEPLGPASALLPGQAREPVRGQPCGSAPLWRSCPTEIGRTRRPPPPSRGPLVSRGAPGGCWRSERGSRARGPRAPAATEAEVTAARAAGGPSVPLPPYLEEASGR